MGEAMTMQYGGHAAGPKALQFQPYAFNGGTILAVAGENFSIVASDLRLSEGYMIHSRHCTKTYKLTDQTYLTCAGFHGDILTLTKIIEARLKMYEHEHQKQMSTGAIAAMLSTILYYRRFFPYYVHNIIGGIDDEGKGAVYSFDPVGSYERETYRAAGSAGAILQPLLDNQIGFKNQHGATVVALSVDRAVALVKDVFISAAERDIHTGDGLQITVVRPTGSTAADQLTFDLRRD